MRKIYVLLGLIALVVVLPGFYSTGSNNTVQKLLGTVALAQQPCCPDGQTYPHNACVGGQCVQVYECGVSDCSACIGCDPDGSREAACISSGGEWDPYSCICYPPRCDPAERQACINQGGWWDDFNCLCDLPCNPGPPVVVDVVDRSLSTCVDCMWAQRCTTRTYYYEQYCQNGTLYDRWSEDYNLGCTWVYNEDCWEWCQAN